MRIHMLHIRKSGGNAVQHALRPYLLPALDVAFHPHQASLADVPTGEKVIFMLRDPVDRFVSGFNSRRRRGRPLRNAEWNAEEAAAFGAFATPDALAVSLSSPDPTIRAWAEAAMRGINHVKSFYADWLGDLDQVRARRADILWVGLTSRLDNDFEELKRLLNLPEDCRLPVDPLAAHRRLETDPVDLSPAGVDNIKSWYAADYRVLAYFFGA